MQSKLKKGKTFVNPQDKLHRIYEIFDEDMVCMFCNSWFYDEIAKVIGYKESEFKEKGESQGMGETTIE